MILKQNLPIPSIPRSRTHIKLSKTEKKRSENGMSEVMAYTVNLFINFQEVKVMNTNHLKYIAVWISYNTFGKGD